MPHENVLKTAHSVVTGLNGLAAIDALQVLSAATDLIIKQCTDDQNRQLNKAVCKSRLEILPNAMHLFKIEKDPEVRDFILTYNKPIHQTELLKLLIKRFGKKRAPSRSGLNRYLLKIMKDA